MSMLTRVLQMHTDISDQNMLSLKFSILQLIHNNLIKKDYKNSWKLKQENIKSMLMYS